MKKNVRHVIFVQPHLHYGGAENQTVLLANALATRGYSCEVILNKAVGGLLPELDEQVRVTELGITGHAATPLIAARLIAVLRKRPPSFVTVKLWSSTLAASLAMPRLPMHTFSLGDDLDPGEHYRHIPLGRLKRRVIAPVFRRAPHVTANTPDVARRMVVAYGLRTTPEVVWCMVDKARMTGRAGSPAPCPTPDETRVVSLGSLVPYKGLDVTLAALRRLALQQPTPDQQSLRHQAPHRETPGLQPLDRGTRGRQPLRRPIRWTVVGTGPLAQQLGAAELPAGLSVDLVGGTPNPYPYLASANLLIHSALTESCGLAVLEALTLGTPVVAAAATGPRTIRERLGTNDQALSLYQPGSVDDLVLHLQRALERPAPPREAVAEYAAAFDSPQAVDAWIERAERLMHETTA